MVLSRGMLLALRTCRDTLELLAERRVAVHRAETSLGTLGSRNRMAQNTFMRNPA